MEKACWIVFENYRQVFHDRAFVLFTLGAIFSGSIWMQMDNYVPVHLKLYFSQLPC
ncbi:hypothetical protein FGCSD_2131 (plasmid) [Streptococcus dysgalactiae]|nr:hypothetical protein FGCSD_2131 [Streptococcus dysgalactiae]